MHKHAAFRSGPWLPVTCIVLRCGLVVIRESGTAGLNSRAMPDRCVMSTYLDLAGSEQRMKAVGRVQDLVAAWVKRRPESCAVRVPATGESLSYTGTVGRLAAVGRRSRRRQGPPRGRRSGRGGEVARARSGIPRCPARGGGLCAARRDGPGGSPGRDPRRGRRRAGRHLRAPLAPRALGESAGRSPH